jgi:hypothetical protein
MYIDFLALLIVQMELCSSHVLNADTCTLRSYSAEVILWAQNKRTHDSAAVRLATYSAFPVLSSSSGN